MIPTLYLKFAKFIRRISLVSFTESFYFILFCSCKKTQTLIPDYVYSMFSLFTRMEQQGASIQKIGRTNLISVPNGSKQCSYKIYLRRKTTDFDVFQEVFVKNEYAPLVNLIQQRKDVNAISNIVDAGANIGCTTIFLKKIFSAATVIAIEPEKSNYSMLLKNIHANNFEKVYSVNGAIWTSNGLLELTNEFKKQPQWGFSVSPIMGNQRINTVTSLTLANIISKYPMTKIDILKIDIEGGEKELFDDIEFNNLLRLVKYLVVEIHDKIANKSDISKCLELARFNYFESGHLLVAYREII